MPRIAVWWRTFAPYCVARLRALAQLEPGVVGVEVASRHGLHSFWGDAGPDGFEKVTIFDRSFESVPVQEQREAAVRCLSDHRANAIVVAGYGDPVMRTAAGWARRQGRPVVLLSESTRADRRRWACKEWPKRLLVRRLYDSAFVGGERSAAYVQQLGVNEDDIWTGYDVVDNEHFRRGADAARRRRDQVRAKLGLPDRYFLYVGRFAREKNLSRLLAAHDMYRRRQGTWELVLVGSGPLQDDLQALADRQGVPGVHWPGPKSYDELPSYYGLASCFVLPSVSEPWGLVVNEAAASGLPMLASQACGCVPELVHRGVNGYCFDPYDVEALAELMLTMSGGDVDLQAFGEASRRIVSLYTPETWARALADCVQTRLETKR